MIVVPMGEPITKRGVVLHQRGEFQIGSHIKLWCVCGWKWEGEGKRAAEEAWEEHVGT